MANKSVTVSSHFQKMALRAILSIILFVFVYLLLVVLAVALTLICGYAGIKLIALKPTIYTFGIGAGLISMGILILIFLFKFIFKKHTIDRSHLTEISQNQEPELFEFIGEIVNEVKTGFPKKVYLSSEVNASVFYDSGFWSMFLPVKKNLHIGLGLVNTVSLLELKAILAHEFGHFSQRSMKVGSYVYNVNQVIYNLLYENESYQALVQKWSSVSRYITFFAGLAIKIVQGIQWVLRRNYKLINLSYMSLSREMEFHADQVAANITGSSPLVTSLLRLELASYALDSVIQYYNNKISASIRTNNIFPQQHLLMNLLARRSKLPVLHNLPQVTVNLLNRYNKSKLIIQDQWASHPGTEDRVNALNKINIIREEETYVPANSIFQQPEVLQVQITDQLFSEVNYPGPEEIEDETSFIKNYAKGINDNSFPDLFNGYYDQKNPGVVESSELNDTSLPINRTAEELFSPEAVDLVYTASGLENDRQTLLQLAADDHAIKYFDYDGVKYTVKDSSELASQLENSLKETNNLIQLNDQKIYRYFHHLAALEDQQLTFVSMYQSCLDANQAYKAKVNSYSIVAGATAFMQQTMPFSQIEMKTDLLKAAEPALKAQIAAMLEDAAYELILTPEIRELFNKYLSKNWTYFEVDHYLNDEVEILFTSMQQYIFILSETYYRIKKELLNFIVRLEEVHLLRLNGLSNEGVA